MKSPGERTARRRHDTLIASKFSRVRAFFTHMTTTFCNCKFPIDYFDVFLYLVDLSANKVEGSLEHPLRPDYVGHFPR